MEDASFVPDSTADKSLVGIGIDLVVYSGRRVVFYIQGRWLSW